MDINFLTPIYQTGYGVVGLNLLAALDRAGHSVALFPIGPSLIPPESELVVQSALRRQTAWNPSAPSVCLKEITFPVEAKGRGRQCLFTVFELDRFSDAELEHLRSADRVFVCTRWAEGVLLAHHLNRASIRIVPLGVDHSVFSESLAPARLESGDTTFVNVGKFELRKGQDFLIEAFNLAFEPKDRVRLLLHGCNHSLGAEFNRFWIDYAKGTRLGGKIKLVQTPFASHREVAQFMAQADCGVFPARAEGWNLELLEMMALGKTVIATDYSGHTEFADAENCLLIKVSSLEDAQDGVKFRGQGRWAQLGPEQLEQLVWRMREVHTRKQSGDLAANRAGIATARQFSWEHSAAALVAGLM